MRLNRHPKQRQKTQLPLNYSTARAILDILFDVSETFPLFTFGNYRKLCRRSLGVPDPPRWRFNRAIKYLEQKGQVKIINRNDQIFVELTKKGKLHVLMSKINKGLPKPIRWDGKWRLVIWDIPESSRRQRNQIRYFFKSLGFYRLQKSVFIIPFSLPQKAVVYLKESGLIKFIRFLRVDKIDDEAFLLKYFSLKRKRN